MFEIRLPMATEKCVTEMFITELINEVIISLFVYGSDLSILYKNIFSIKLLCLLFVNKDAFFIYLNLLAEDCVHETKFRKMVKSKGNSPKFWS